MEVADGSHLCQSSNPLPSFWGRIAADGGMGTGESPPLSLTNPTFSVPGMSVATYAHFNAPSTLGQRKKAMRVPLACDQCRAGKAACSGEPASCGRCLDRGFQCSYRQVQPNRLDGKLDRLEQKLGRLEQLEQKLDRLEQLPQKLDTVLERLNTNTLSPVAFEGRRQSGADSMSPATIIRDEDAEKEVIDSFWEHVGCRYPLLKRDEVGRLAELFRGESEACAPAKRKRTGNEEDREMKTERATFLLVRAIGTFWQVYRQPSTWKAADTPGRADVDEAVRLRGELDDEDDLSLIVVDLLEAIYYGGIGCARNGMCSFVRASSALKRLVAEKFARMEHITAQDNRVLFSYWTGVMMESEIFSSYDSQPTVLPYCLHQYIHAESAMEWGLGEEEVHRYLTRIFLLLTQRTGLTLSEMIERIEKHSKINSMYGTATDAAYWTTVADICRLSVRSGLQGILFGTVEFRKGVEALAESVTRSTSCGQPRPVALGVESATRKLIKNLMLLGECYGHPSFREYVERFNPGELLERTKMWLKEISSLPSAFDALTDSYAAITYLEQLFPRVAS